MIAYQSEAHDLVAFGRAAVLVAWTNEHIHESDRVAISLEPHDPRDGCDSRVSVPSKLAPLKNQMC